MLYSSQLLVLLTDQLRLLNDITSSCASTTLQLQIMYLSSTALTHLSRCSIHAHFVSIFSSIEEEPFAFIILHVEQIQQYLNDYLLTGVTALLPHLSNVTPADISLCISSYRPVSRLILSQIRSNYHKCLIPRYLRSISSH